LDNYFHCFSGAKQCVGFLLPARSAAMMVSKQRCGVYMRTPRLWLQSARVQVSIPAWIKN
jgi:hypothetical protein